MSTSASASNWCRQRAPGCPTATCPPSSTSPGGQRTTSATTTSASRAAGTPAAAGAGAQSGSGQLWTPAPAASTSCPPPRQRAQSSAYRCQGPDTSHQQSGNQVDGAVSILPPAASGSRMDREVQE